MKAPSTSRFVAESTEIATEFSYIDFFYLREGSTPSFINSTEPALVSPAGDLHDFQ